MAHLRRALRTSPANDIEEGYRLGRVGLALHDRYRVKVWLPRLSATYYLGIHGFKHPISTSLEPLQLAQRVGTETGDMGVALLCGVLHCFSQLETRPLPVTEAQYQRLREQMTFYGQKTPLEITKPSLQAIHNLMGRGNMDPTTLCGEIMDEGAMRELEESKGKLFVFAHFYLMLLGYLFGDYEQAAKSSKVLRVASDYPFGALDAALIVLFDGLVAVQNVRIFKKRRMLRSALKQLRRMRHWAMHAPTTFLCRQFLLEAEIAAVSGDRASVYSKYVGAIALSKDSGFIFLTALGNELAGKYYLRERKDKETAMPFLLEALHHYERWGAKAKVEHLTLELKLTL
jgi:histidine kinase